MKFLKKIFKKKRGKREKVIKKLPKKSFSTNSMKKVTRDLDNNILITVIDLGENDLTHMRDTKAGEKIWIQCGEPIISILNSSSPFLPKVEDENGNIIYVFIECILYNDFKNDSTTLEFLIISPLPDLTTDNIITGWGYGGFVVYYKEDEGSIISSSETIVKMEDKVELVRKDDMWTKFSTGLITGLGAHYLITLVALNRKQKKFSNWELASPFGVNAIAGKEYTETLTINGLEEDVRVIVSPSEYAKQWLENPST